MSSIVLSGDTSGTVTVAVPAVAGTNTVTIAAQTGTLNAAGPCFSAYQSSSQTINSGGATVKVNFQSEEFDTNNCFDSTTNYRFTPNVAGYYQFNASIGWGGNITSGQAIGFLKNGSLFKLGNYFANSNIGPITVISSLIYCNGSTDYVEVCGINNTSGNLTLQASATYTYFQGFLARGA